MRIFINLPFQGCFLESAYIRDRLICEDIRYLKIEKTRNLILG